MNKLEIIKDIMNDLNNFEDEKNLKKVRAIVRGLRDGKKDKVRISKPYLFKN